MQTCPRMSCYAAELLLVTMVCFSYSTLMTVGMALSLIRIIDTNPLRVS